MGCEGDQCQNARDLILIPFPGLKIYYLAKYIYIYIEFKKNFISKFLVNLPKIKELHPLQYKYRQLS